MEIQPFASRLQRGAARAQRLLPNQQKKNNEECETKKKKEVNLVISHATSADNSNLSADGDDSFVSVEMDSAMPSPFSEVRESRGGGGGGSVLLWKGRKGVEEDGSV